MYKVHKIKITYKHLIKKRGKPLPIKGLPLFLCTEHGTDNFLLSLPSFHYLDFKGVHHQK